MRRLLPALLAVALLPVLLGAQGCYYVPSSSMEPTLHCARPGAGCLGKADDLVDAQPIERPRRGEIVVFRTPRLAAKLCGSGGTFVKRVVGLPGGTVVYARRGLRVDGRRIREPYVRPGRGGGALGRWHVPRNAYFVMGDNRRESCDSRIWGPVPRGNLIARVVAVYRGSKRIPIR